MRTMKIGAAALAAICGGGMVAFASPQIGDDVSLTRKQDGQTAVIKYSLAEEPAVVTVDVLIGGESAGASARLCVTGDVNRLVQPGTRKAIMQLTGALASVAPLDLSVKVRAWPTNCPPDYLVVSLTNATEAARYYLTEADVPGGVSHSRYKTSHIVMRKIPAANVEWRMGSSTLEIGRQPSLGSGNSWTAYSGFENSHYVRLTEDYYIGIYPVTYRQHVNVAGAFSQGMWANDEYADYRTDDMPLSPAQFVSLRSWMHDNNNGCSGSCGVSIKYWPHDGHDIDAANSPKCVKSGGTYTPYLRSWRNNTGFAFDLPTDAQWEFACRAGTGGRTYNSDSAVTREAQMPENLGDIAWSVVNSSNATHNCALPHPVGLKTPNSFGLYDMIGNVWELCLDRQTEARGAPEEASVDPDGGDFVNDRMALRVIRGGSFNSDIRCCRSAMRGAIAPTILNGAPYSVDNAPAAFSVGYRVCLPAAAIR